MQEHRLQAVGVCRPELVASALGHADHQRHGDLAAEHVADVGRAVDDLVEREQREVDRHQLNHWPQPAHRGAHGDPDDRVLRDRRIAHAPLAELLQQTGRDLEGPAEHTDVLAHQHHALVAPQLLAQRRVQRLAVAQLRHQDSSSLSSSAVVIRRGTSPELLCAESELGSWEPVVLTE